VPATALDLGYRRSAVAPHHVVVEAELALAPGDPERGAELLSEIVAWRREHQPGGPNAGSVFTNPDGDSAGRLIDEAGLKGLRMGTAEVSPKHANFIQADEGGRADDVFALMGEVRRRVREQLGVDLRPETRCLGFGDLDLQSRVNPEGEVEG
jgi:UDP-N-acetylmuramate dehydrogenase